MSDGWHDPPQPGRRNRKGAKAPTRAHLEQKLTALRVERAAWLAMGKGQGDGFWRGLYHDIVADCERRIGRLEARLKEGS